MGEIDDQDRIRLQEWRREVRESIAKENEAYASSSEEYSSDSNEVANGSNEEETIDSNELSNDSTLSDSLPDLANNDSGSEKNDEISVSCNSTHPKCVDKRISSLRWVEGDQRFNPDSNIGDAGSFSHSWFGNIDEEPNRPLLLRDDIKIEIGNMKESDLKSGVQKVRIAPTRSCNLNKVVNYVTPHEMDFYLCDYTAKHSMVKGPNRKLHPVHIG